MFVELQSLSAPCWKVVTWWIKLKEHMEWMQADFSLTAPTSMLPMLEANIDDIQSGEYKGTCLVPGWMIVSTKKDVDEMGKTIVTDKWIQRQVVDVEIDMKTFMKDILTSFESRISKCTKEMQYTLRCMDLDTLFSLLCGERLGNGKLKLEHGEGLLQSHGVEDFERFFRYRTFQRYNIPLDSTDMHDAQWPSTVVHKFSPSFEPMSKTSWIKSISIVHLKHASQGNFLRIKFLIISSLNFILPILFRYICSLLHVCQLNDLSSNDNNVDKEVCFEPGLGAITFHKLKQALKNTRGVLQGNT